MRFLVDTWRRIGARLYLALGFAVFLTLVSSAVGVYYFERSGDLNFQVRSESVPVLEASWTATRESERLRAVGLKLLSDPESGFENDQSDSVTESLGRLEDALSVVSGVSQLSADAQGVQDAAHGLAVVIDELAVNRDALLEANAVALNLRGQVDSLRAGSGPSEAMLSVLERMLVAEDAGALEGLWDEFVALAASGAEPAVESLVEDRSGIFATRGQQLALRVRAREMVGDFDTSSQVLEEAASALLAGARSESAVVLESSARAFDEGRILLAAVSLASVIVATLAAWLWVGNGVVRRLSRLSERMRGMASGDLETPVPEVSRDEIGELANALEVFRQQALEVQRLNLVERLYGELREANSELERMQVRLVAQEKLAALGELVSGVAHEISNPLNFVKNFSEGSLELYGELTEVLENYRDEMKEEDASLMDEITEDLADSLGRVQSNGERVLAIVERMRGLGVVGGEPEPGDLNSVLRTAASAACNVFQSQWEDFRVQPLFEFDSSLGPVPLVEQDLGQAVVNLVSNSCYAMRLKQVASGDGYEPLLTVSSRLADDVVEVRVWDNGTGITDDVIGHIFNPFFSTREGALGAGLGLPIAADVARRAGGDLTVSTVVGEYAEFTLSLPASASRGACRRGERLTEGQEVQDSQLPFGS